MTRSGERLGIPRLVELSLVCVLIGSTGLYGARVVSRAVTQWADLRAAAAQPDDRVRTIPTGSGLRAAVADGAPFGTLEIPRLHLLASIREGVADHTLDLAVGRIPGTSPTPARGNLGLAAHRDTLFRPLRAVRVGDVVHVSTEGKTFTYLVKQVLIVNPDEVWVLDPTPRPSVTLVTCYPFTYLGNAPRRFIVRAERHD